MIEIIALIAFILAIGFHLYLGLLYCTNNKVWEIPYFSYSIFDGHKHPNKYVMDNTEKKFKCISIVRGLLLLVALLFGLMSKLL